LNTAVDTAPERTRHLGLIVYATLSVGIVGVFFLTNWPTYNFLVRGGTGLLWYYMIPCVLVVPVICAEPQLVGRLLREPLFWWMVVFVVCGILWITISQDFSDEAMNRWRSRVAAFALFSTIAVLSTQSKRALIALLITGAIVLATASTWYDTLRPFKFVPEGDEWAHSGRGAGLFVNPNVAASFLAAAAIAALPLLPMGLRALVVLCAIVGIVPTFSRSGYIYAGMLLILPIVFKLLDKKQTLLLIVAVPLLVAATAVSYDQLLRASDDPRIHDVARRLQWFEGLDADQDEAVEGRLYGARMAWNLFVESPITGAGMGITNIEIIVKQGPHNMYLMMMAEQGFVGLALYLSFLWLVWWAGRQLSKTALDQQGRDIGRSLMFLALFFSAYSFFSHNVLEEPQMLFVLAFLVAAAAESPRARPVWVSPPVSQFRRRASVIHARPG
jgi:O-antigen ligase